MPKKPTKPVTPLTATEKNKLFVEMADLFATKTTANTVKPLAVPTNMLAEAGKVGKPPDPIGTVAFWSDGIYQKVQHTGKNGDWKWIGNHPTGANPYAEKTKFYPDGTVKVALAGKKELTAKGIDPDEYAAKLTKENKAKIAAGQATTPGIKFPVQTAAITGDSKTVPVPINAGGAQAETPKAAPKDKAPAAPAPEPVKAKAPEPKPEPAKAPEPPKKSDAEIKKEKDAKDVATVNAHLAAAASSGDVDKVIKALDDAAKITGYKDIETLAAHWDGMTTTALGIHPTKKAPKADASASEIHAHVWDAMGEMGVSNPSKLDNATLAAFNAIYGTGWVDKWDAAEEKQKAAKAELEKVKKAAEKEFADAVGAHAATVIQQAMKGYYNSSDAAINAIKKAVKDQFGPEAVADIGKHVNLDGMKGLIDGEIAKKKKAAHQDAALAALQDISKKAYDGEFGPGEKAVEALKQHVADTHGDDADAIIGLIDLDNFKKNVDSHLASNAESDKKQAADLYNAVTDTLAKLAPEVASGQMTALSAATMAAEAGFEAIGVDMDSAEGADEDTKKFKKLYKIAAGKDFDLGALKAAAQAAADTHKKATAAKPALPLDKFVTMLGGPGQMDANQKAQAAKHYGPDWEDQYAKLSGGAGVKDTPAAVPAPEKLDLAGAPYPTAMPAAKAENAKSIYSWSVQLAKKLHPTLKFGASATPSNLIKYLSNHPEIVDQYAKHYGPNWFHEMSDAFLLHRGPEEIANKGMGGAKWLAQVFGADWHDKMKKLQAGEAVGSVKAAPLAKLDPNSATAKAPGAPAPAATPAAGSTTPQFSGSGTFEKHHAAEISGTLVANYSTSPIQMAGPANLGLFLQKNPDFNDAAIKAFGQDWADQYAKVVWGKGFSYKDFPSLKGSASAPAPATPKGVGTLTTSNIPDLTPEALDALDSDVQHYFYSYQYENPESFALALAGGNGSTHTKKSMDSDAGAGWEKAYFKAKWGEEGLKALAKHFDDAYYNTTPFTPAELSDISASPTFKKQFQWGGNALNVMARAKKYPEWDAEMSAHYGPDWKIKYAIGAGAYTHYKKYFPPEEKQDIYGGHYTDGGEYMMPNGTVVPSGAGFTPKLKAHKATVHTAVTNFLHQYGIDFDHPHTDKYFSAQFGPGWKQKFKAIGAPPAGKMQPKVQVGSGPFLAPATPPAVGVEAAEIVAGAFPALWTLKHNGNAQQKLKGNKAKDLYVSNDGKQFMFKPVSGEETSRAAAGHVASVIATAVLGKEHAIPVQMAKLGDQTGSIQPLWDAKGTLENVSFAALSKAQLAQFQREKVVDWLISSHDSKPGNFIMTADGKIVAVDREQAFKYIGDDELNDTYKPNASQQAANLLYSLYGSGGIDLDPADMLPAIEQVEAISDDEYEKMVQPYLAAAAKDFGWSASQQKQQLQKMLDRKNNIRKDFEEFWTKLKKKRKEIGPGASFKFPTTSTSVSTGFGGLPVASSLTPAAKQVSLKGAGSKVILEDPTGKKYLFRHAMEKGGGKAKPYAAHVQQAFSAIAMKVKPDSHMPVAVMEHDGNVGTVQAFIDPVPPGIVGVAPASLSDQEKLDVASEHVLDWLGSQHDSHGDQFLRVNGRVIGIDKEQGFRFFGTPGNFGKGDKLSVDFHPNTMEKPPYYNQFWKDWTDGKFEFDPMKLASTIGKIEKIHDLEYKKNLRPYIESLYPNNKLAQEEFLAAATARKDGIRKDFEEFLTDLYQKKTGKKGQFTFMSGWVEGSGLSKVKKYKLKASEVLGAYNIAQKEYMDPATGTKDATIGASGKITLKMHKSEPDTKMQDFFKEFGITPVMGPVMGASYYVAVVNASDLNKEIEKEEIVDLSTNVLAQPTKPESFPEKPVVQQAHPNVGIIKDLATDYLGAGGKRLFMDGGSIEGQVAKVQRHKDTNGNEYFQFAFKLRKDTWASIGGGTETKFHIPQTTYDATNDIHQDKGQDGDAGYRSLSGKQWKDGNSAIHVCTSESQYGYMGMVHAKVYLNAGEDPEQALRRMLKKMSPTVEKALMKEPTPEEREAMKLRRLLWAVDWKKATNLPPNATVQQIKSALAGKVTAEDMANVKEVDILDGHMTHVLPGRHKKLAGGAVKYLFNGISDADAALSVLQKGLLGINERAHHGIYLTGGSVGADIGTGSSDGILTRVVTMSGVESQASFSNHAFGGDFQALISPEELDRLDPYIHLSDNYGSCKPGAHGWSSHPDMEAALKTQAQTYSAGAEVSFRKGINTNKILRMVTQSAHSRETLIKNAKKAGILEVNGVPIDDFIVVSQNLKDAYEKYVKPMGF